MASYIVLMNYTTQGLQNIQESPSRADAVKQLAVTLGGEVKELFLTMGSFDLVAIVEAPNDEAVAKVALALGAKGNVETTTMRAFTESEFRDIVGALS